MRLKKIIINTTVWLSAHCTLLNKRGQLQVYYVVLGGLPACGRVFVLIWSVVVRQCCGHKIVINLE